MMHISSCVLDTSDVRSRCRRAAHSLRDWLIALYEVLRIVVPTVALAMFAVVVVHRYAEVRRDQDSVELQPVHLRLHTGPLQQVATKTETYTLDRSIDLQKGEHVIVQTTGERTVRLCDAHSRCAQLVPATALPHAPAR